MELVLPEDDEDELDVPTVAAHRPLEHRPVQQSVSVAHVALAARHPVPPSTAAVPLSLVSTAWHFPSSLQ